MGIKLSGSMMPLYLHNRWYPDHAYEVLSFDKAAHKAVLRGANGVVTDPNFHIEVVRRCYTLTEVKPECLKGK